MHCEEESYHLGASVLPSGCFTYREAGLLRKKASWVLRKYLFLNLTSYSPLASGNSDKITGKIPHEKTTLAEKVDLILTVLSVKR